MPKGNTVSKKTYEREIARLKKRHERAEDRQDELIGMIRAMELQLKALKDEDES